MQFHGSAPGFIFEAYPLSFAFMCNDFMKFVHVPALLFPLLYGVAIFSIDFGFSTVLLQNKPRQDTFIFLWVKMP